MPPERFWKNALIHRLLSKVLGYRLAMGILEEMFEEQMQLKVWGVYNLTGD